MMFATYRYTTSLQPSYFSLEYYAPFVLIASYTNSYPI